MKRSKLLVVLLSFVCIICAAIGFTACDPDDKDVVIKEGNTKIGTVTTEGVTYSVKGKVDTIYKLTATVDGEASEDVFITVGDVENTAFVLFTYKTGCEATFTAVSEDVENVTVVLEKYVEGLPEYTTHNLTEANPTVDLDSIDVDDNVYVAVATESGKTYTITSSNEGVSFGFSGIVSAGSVTFKGSTFGDYDNVATYKLSVASKVENVTLTLSVQDGEEEEEVPAYDAIPLGEEVSVAESEFVGGEAHYSLVVNADTVYTVTTNSYVTFECNGTTATDIVTVDASAAIADGEESVTVTIGLTAGTYTVTIYDDQKPAKVTITANTTLTAAHPIFVDVDGTVIVYAIVDADKNYTVTTDNAAVSFVSFGIGGMSTSSSLELIGADYDDPAYNGVATLRLTAETLVTKVTLTLAVSTGEGGDEGDEGDDDNVITLGQTYTVEYVPGGADIVFKLNVIPGTYQITFGGTDAANALLSYLDDNMESAEVTSENNTITLSYEDVYEFACLSADWNAASYTITFTKVS